LTNLTELYLSDNQITDIGVLGGLTNLTELDLEGNPLSPESEALVETLRGAV
jgi:Leucine-rich repeat (LRR) protein